MSSPATLVKPAMVVRSLFESIADWEARAYFGAERQFTKTPNPCYDILAGIIPSDDLRIMGFFVRQAYGFSRKTTDLITASQYQISHGVLSSKSGRMVVTGTGIPERTLIRSLERLKASQVLLMVSPGRAGRPSAQRKPEGTTWAVNENPVQWNFSPFFGHISIVNLEIYIKLATDGSCPPPRNLETVAALRSGIIRHKTNRNQRQIAKLNAIVNQWEAEILAHGDSVPSNLDTLLTYTDIPAIPAPILSTTEIIPATVAPITDNSCQTDTNNRLISANLTPITPHIPATVAPITDNSRQHDTNSEIITATVAPIMEPEAADGQEFFERKENNIKYYYSSNINSSNIKDYYSNFYSDITIQSMDSNSLLTSYSINPFCPRVENPENPSLPDDSFRTPGGVQAVEEEQEIVVECTEWPEDDSDLFFDNDEPKVEESPVQVLPPVTTKKRGRPKKETVLTESVPTVAPKAVKKTATKKAPAPSYDGRAPQEWIDEFVARCYNGRVPLNFKTEAIQLHRHLRPSVPLDIVVAYYKHKQKKLPQGNERIIPVSWMVRDITAWSQYNSLMRDWDIRHGGDASMTGGQEIATVDNDVPTDDCTILLSRMRKQQERERYGQAQRVAVSG